MAIRIIDDVLRCGRFFTRGEKPVIVSLANNADEDGMARPSEGEIAWNSSRSVRQVRRDLKSLQRLRVIEIVEGGGRKTNRYWLDIDLLARMSAEFKRVKAKALQDGVDRYAEMDKVARDFRAHQEGQAVPRNALGPDKASDLPVNRVPEAHPVNGEGPGSAVNLSPQYRQVANNEDTLSDSSGHHDHRTFIEPFKNPSLKAPKETVQSTPKASKVTPADFPPHPRERAQQIEALANLLGMTDLQLMRTAGDPDAAAKLANDLASGELALDEVRCVLAKSENGADTDDQDSIKALT